MMMMVNLEHSDLDMEQVRNELNSKAEQMGVQINIMNEKVFSAMHRV